MPPALSPTVIAADLNRWDQARPGDLLMVPVYEDVRPLRGAAGLLDWRLCGKLSALVIESKLTGADGEQMLFPSGDRVAWRLVLAAGAGPRAELGDKRFRAMLKRMLKTLRGLNLTRLAVALPGREGEAVPPGAPVSPLSSRRALDLVLAEIEAAAGVVAELTVLVAPAAQKEIAEAVRVRAGRS